MKRKIKIIAGLFLITNSMAGIAASKYTAINLDELGFGNLSIAAINNNGIFAGAKVDQNGIPTALGIWDLKSETIIDESKINLGSVLDINDKSQVVTYEVGQFGRSFVYDAGNLIELPTLGGHMSSPWQINNSGQVAGHATTARGIGLSETHAVIWDNGTPIDLGTAGFQFRSYAFGLNDKGDAVGYSGNHAVLWSEGKTITLDMLADSHSARATDINNFGQIIGEMYAGNQQLYATFWDNGDVYNLGSLGGNFTQAQAINDAGQIVGNSSTPDSPIGHGFIWENGRMIELTSIMDESFISSGYIIGDAWDINNKGEILASAFNPATGDRYDILLQPVSPIPEPMTYAMLLAGLGIVGFMSRARV